MLCSPGFPSFCPEAFSGREVPAARVLTHLTPDPWDVLVDCFMPFLLLLEPLFLPSCLLCCLSFLLAPSPSLALGTWQVAMSQR